MANQNPLSEPTQDDSETPAYASQKIEYRIRLKARPEKFTPADLYEGSGVINVAVRAKNPEEARKHAHASYPERNYRIIDIEERVGY